MANLKLEIQRLIGKYPSLYCNLYKFRPNYRDLIVKKKTQIVIEACPRSGNTFAVIAFQLAQSNKVKIAHHMHSPAQILQAIKFNIPNLVIMRNPIDVVTSWLIRDVDISPKQAFKNYISFYDTIYPYNSHFVFAKFEDIINNFGIVIERINKKFNTSFSIFENSDENLQIVFSTIENLIKERLGRIDENKISRPSKKRKKIKEDLKLKLLNNNKLKSFIQHSENIYQKYMGFS